MSTDLEIAYCYLQPGVLYCCKTPMSVTTLLGSCVSITMFSRRYRIGAICHGLLPECGTKGCRGNCINSSRYVSCSIRSMFAWFVNHGLKPVELDIKLFGGADVMAPQNRIQPGIGTQNVAQALTVLDSFGLKPAKIDVGGGVGRKIIFNSYTGEVLLKRLRGGEDGLRRSETGTVKLSSMPVGAGAVK